MKFYRLNQGVLLHSFEDPIGDCSILKKKLNDHQKESILAVGGQLIDIESEDEISESDPHFVFSEDLFFSKPFLESAVEHAKTATSNLRFCVDRKEYNERYVLPQPQDTEQHHVYNFHFRKGEKTEKLQEINQVVFEHAYTIPDQIVKGRRYHMHQSETFAMHITSPFHLLFANLALNLERTVRLQKKIPKWVKERFGTYGGKWFYRGLKRLNKIGKNCNIHPSAIIEGSVIGDNVTIGANSIVRLSHLSSNCYVSENVSVINSILHEGTFISNSNYINSCVCLEETFLIHGPYHLSIFGRHSACFAVINCDIRLDQKTIRIPTSTGIMDSAQEIIGIAYGHRSKTGGGNIIAAGRIVPNDLHINPPDNIILQFDKP